MTPAIPIPDLYPFVSVLLRALTLSFEALTVGGVIFRFSIAYDVDRPSADRLSKTLVAFSALLLATQFAYLANNSVVLMRSASLSPAEVIGAKFFMAGATVALGAGVSFGFAHTRFWKIACPVGCLLVLIGAVMTSHSAARLNQRPVLLALTTTHHIASAAWIGGLPYLLLCLRRIEDERISAAILKRFSTMALISVLALAGAGLLMSRLYIGSVSALTGTSYGAMVLSKLVLTGLLLTIGAINFRIVRSIRNGGRPRLLPLRRFAEAEIGIGVTILLAAASLTSSPPAIDIRDRVSPSEIRARLTPWLPRMRTPGFGELSKASTFEQPTGSGVTPSSPAQTTKQADIAWSEYNHHWAGLVVLAIGILSLAARRWTWARGWPLVFLGLAVFLLIRADAENWPLGPRGFWESFQVAEVAQHRLFVVLIVMFAIFEWRVQNSKVALARASLVFPLVCAAGGALLLMHSHSLNNVKEEFLAELSHTTLAILAVVAGWSRWVEIRLAKARSPLGWVWPICFALIGAVLLNYREA